MKQNQTPDDKPAKLPKLSVTDKKSKDQDTIDRKKRFEQALKTCLRATQDAINARLDTNTQKEPQKIRDACFQLAVEDLKK
jgi:hypothetical protein